MIVDACVDMIAGVNVADGTAVRICVADVGTLYRGVGINRAGVLVGVDVGIGGDKVWQAAMEIQTSKVKRYLQFIKIKIIFTTELTEDSF